MHAWLIPVLKSVLPHVGTIVSAAAPVFTRKSADASQTALLQQQIGELQAAAAENDAHIKALALQMQHAVEALEQGTALAERSYRRAMMMSAASLVMSVAALCAVAYVGLA